MENNKQHPKSHAGGSFLAGFLLGAIFASLLTTKKGRAILREIVNAGMEMVEDFLAERKDKEYEKKVAQREAVVVATEKEEVADATLDIESEITASETPAPEAKAKAEPETTEAEIEINEVSVEAIDMAKSTEEEKPAKLGSKRRLFKGIRKTKAN